MGRDGNEIGWKWDRMEMGKGADVGRDANGQG